MSIRNAALACGFIAAVFLAPNAVRAGEFEPPTVPEGATVVDKPTIKGTLSMALNPLVPGVLAHFEGKCLGRIVVLDVIFFGLGLAEIEDDLIGFFLSGETGAAASVAAQTAGKCNAGTGLVIDEVTSLDPVSGVFELIGPDPFTLFVTADIIVRFVIEPQI